MWWMLVTYELTAYVTCFLSIILNGYLFYLICKHTSIAMKPYSKILLQTVITDVVTSLAFTFVQMKIESVQNIIFSRGGPLWFGSTHPLKCFTVPAAGTVAIVCYWSTPLQSLYRYFLVCRKTVLSVYKTIAIQSGVIIISIAVSTYFYLAFQPISDNIEKFQVLDSLPIWANETDNPSNFCFAYINTTNVTLYCIFMITVINLGFVVLILSFWRVYKYLEASRSIMSTKTRRIHLEFSRRTLYQTILPGISAILIVVIVVCVQFLPSYEGGLYVFLFTPYYFNSVLNPLITISCVHHYRYTTECILWRKKIVVSSENTTVKNIQGAQSESKRASLPVFAMRH
uniref:G_PROTEIN_RECEP_F1_2 domain-containing protein n=1 Tax=Panagrellus redivivus TaxID=6233 RepID=A0A7E5A1M2_PANRE